MAIHIPDVSEFQGNVDWAKVNGYNGGHAIIRAAYGAAHDDRAWRGGARRDAFWRAKGRTLGIYQYLVADQNPVDQAKALVRLIGKLKPGEYVICDLEEGSGNQADRFRAWAAVVDARLTYPGYHHSWVYSGEYFAKEHGLAAIAKNGHHSMWLAAYGQAEPKDVPHVLWQYTDAAVIPGIPGHVDCSVFEGSAAALLKVIYHEPKHPAPRPKPTPHPAPVVNHPFAELRVDGELGPQTVAALNYWLGVRAHPVTAICGRTVRALQHKTGATVDGAWGVNNCGYLNGCRSDTTGHLQRFLSGHGYKGFKADGTAWSGGATFKALQQFLNQKVGLYK